MDEEMKKLIKAKDDLIKLLAHINELENKNLQANNAMSASDIKNEIKKNIENSSSPLTNGSLCYMQIEAIKSYVFNVMVGTFVKEGK